MSLFNIEDLSAKILEYEDLIMFPVKFRYTVATGETTIGHANMLQVDSVQAAEDGSPWLTIITFKNGYQLFTQNTVSTLNGRHNFLATRAQGPAHSGLSRHMLSSLLPNCDCLLRDLFVDILDLHDSEKSPEQEN